MFFAPAVTLAAIVADCSARRPREACSVLLGHYTANTVRLVKAVPVENVWPEPAERTHRYAIDPKTQMLTDRVAVAEGLDVIGYYHSHPHGPAVPSTFDLGQAWPRYVYLIVGFDGLKEPTGRAWTLDGDGTFVEHPIVSNPD